MGLEALEWNDSPGDDEIAWAEVLRALTPDWPNDEPWSLVAPPEHPALLQAPIPQADFPELRKEFKNKISTPDALDMLVTAKNHDLKGTRMAHSLPTIGCLHWSHCKRRKALWVAANMASHG